MKVRKADIQGTTITIKYFKKISLANKFIYRYIRKSKAQRAYEHSLLILNKGFSTPSPIAYINCYKNGMLSQSYYLCLYSSDKPLETIFSLPVQESVKGLKAFGDILIVCTKPVFFTTILTLEIYYTLLLIKDMNLIL